MSTIASLSTRLWRYDAGGPHLAERAAVELPRVSVSVRSAQIVDIGS